MKRLTGYLVVAALAFGALVPSSALAIKEVVVPPGNAGVNQYTQTVPTAGGNAVVKNQKARQPKQVLGQKGAAELESEGPEGKAAAELAAQGAQPVEASEENSPVGKHAKGGGGPSNGGKGGGNGQGGGKARGGKSSGGKAKGDAGASTEAHAPVSEGGSSGVGRIVDQVTGSGSSGELGLWMPIALLVGLAWCIAYSWRRRRHAS